MADDQRNVRVTYPGGRSPRQHAIELAQAWQREVAEANSPVPSAAYLVVRDLLGLLLAEDTPQQDENARLRALPSVAHCLELEALARTLARALVDVKNHARWVLPGGAESLLASPAVQALVRD